MLEENCHLLAIYYIFSEITLVSCILEERTTYLTYNRKGILSCPGEEGQHSWTGMLSKNIDKAWTMSVCSFVSLVLPSPILMVLEVITQCIGSGGNFCKHASEMQPGYVADQFYWSGDHLQSCGSCDWILFRIDYVQKCGMLKLLPVQRGRPPTRIW